MAKVKIFRKIGGRVRVFYVDQAKRAARAIAKKSPSKPIRGYHGTNEPFSKFSFKKQSNNELSQLGVWFSNKPKPAKDFAKHETATEYYADFPLIKKKLPLRRSGRGQHYKKLRKGVPDTYPKRIRQTDKYQRVIAADIKLKKPLEIHSTGPGKRDALEKLMDLRDKISKPERYGGEGWRSRYIEKNRDEATQKLKKILQKRGYDGIILKNTNYDAGKGKTVDQIVVFGNKNIKQLRSMKIKKKRRK